MSFRNENAATTAIADTAEAGRKRARLRMAIMGGAVAVLPVAGLVTATSASAAPVSTWDKVAQCESTGDWSINTGNGFYGGLQFTSSTWAAYGGTQYASQANQATKAQQISVAEKVLADQGPGAWPVCSIQAGLTRGGAAAAVDTSSSSSSSSAKSAAAPAQSAKPAAKPSTQQSAPQASKPAPAAAPAQAPAAKPSTAPATNGGSYTVKSGDTLSDIAAAKGLDWHTLYKNNVQVIGGNADLILPGQVLSV